MTNDPLEPIISGMIKVIDEKLKKDPSAETLCLTMSRNTAEDLRGELSYLSYLRKSPLIRHEDEVEVVRCKDCVHNVRYNGKEYDKVCPGYCEDPGYSWTPEDDWFCANGERKDTDD